jgi:thiol:disulfide interchange protein DsbC
MVRDIALPTTAAICDNTALSRNMELGRKHKITGTPTLFFSNGKRVPGAIDTAHIESYLAQAKP